MFARTDEDHIMRLVAEAQEDRERKRDIVRRVEAMALGPYGEDYADVGEQPENMAFATAALLLPSMVQTPVASVVSHGDTQQRLTAASVQGAVNQIARQSQLHRVLRPCAWDYIMGWTIGFVESAPAERSDPTDAERAMLDGPLRGGIATPAGPAEPALRLPAMWPRVSYIHPDRFFFDTKARTQGAWKFCGHSNVENHDVLIERAEADSETWNVGAVKELKAVQSPEALQYAMSKGERVVDRDEVLYYVIYEPGGEIEGEARGPWDHGVIHTIAPMVTTAQAGGRATSTGIELRKPYYYTGHPGGPYAFAGQYTHTSDSFPVTALLANLHSVEMLNAVASSIHDRIRKHRVNFAYDLKSKEGVEALIHAPDSTWVGVQNLNEAAIQTIESGGPTPAEINELGLLQARAAANLALDDAVRGRVDSDATATAVQQVAATTQARTDFLLDGWKLFVGEVLERIAVHVVQNDRFFIRLDDQGRDEVRTAALEAAAPYLADMMGEELTSADRDRMLQRSRPVAVPFAGGDFKDDPLKWWDLQLEVRPEAMEPSGLHGTVRQQAIDGLLQFYAQGMVTMPHVNWKQRAREHFARIGAPGMERHLDEQRASALVGLQVLGVEPGMSSSTEMGQQRPTLGAVGAIGGGGPEVPEMAEAPQ